MPSISGDTAGGLPRRDVKGSLPLLAASVAICLLAVATCVALDRYGRGSRVTGPVSAVSEGARPVLVASPVDAYRLWRAKGYHGRTLLYLADRWEGLSQEEIKELNPAEANLSYPLPTYRIADRVEQRGLSPRTFLYVAALQGVARRIVAVLSPEGFAAQREIAGRAKNARVEAQLVYMTHEGFPRWFAPLAALPPQEEPVLVLVSASVFRTITPGELRELLKSRGIRSDCVILSRDEGSPFAGEPERARLREFAALIGGAR